MLLKLPVYTITPATPGQPARPAKPATPPRKVCGSASSAGASVVCSTVRLWIPENGGVILPPGTTSTTTGVANGKAYVDAFVCRSENPAQTGPITCTTLPGQPAQPEQPAIPPAPASISAAQSFAWTAGANSVQELDGNLIVRFVQDAVIGVVTGLTNMPTGVPARERISHGLFFYQTTTGAPRVRAFEAGYMVGPETVHQPELEYSVRRSAGVVTYWAGDSMLYQSASPSSGPVKVGTSVFASGDTVPGNTIEVEE